MQIDFFRTAFSCQLDHRHDVVFVAVDAARRHQAHDMHGFARGNGFIDRASQYRVGKEGALFNFNVQTGQILIHDAARAEVDVAHFGVAHLAIRQTDFQAGSVNQGMRAFCPQCVHNGGFGAVNCVILLVFTIAIAIQNHQYHRFFRNRHCDNLMLKDRKICVILLQLNRSNHRERSKKGSGQTASFR